MPKRSSKRPRDLNSLAASLVEDATDEPEPTPPESEGRSAAAELGRRGGLKGGKARAANMTPEQRREAARKAATARWANR